MSPNDGKTGMRGEEIGVSRQTFAYMEYDGTASPSEKAVGESVIAVEEESCPSFP